MQILEWEEVQGQAFLVRGTRYVVSIEEQEQKGAAAKEEERARREKDKEEERQRKAAARNAPHSPVVSAVRPGRLGTSGGSGPRVDSPVRRSASARKEPGRFGTVPQRSPASRTPIKSSRAPGAGKLAAGEAGKENSAAPSFSAASARTGEATGEQVASNQRLPLGDSSQDNVASVLGKQELEAKGSCPTKVDAEKACDEADANNFVAGEQPCEVDAFGEEGVAEQQPGEMDADGDQEAALLMSPEPGGREAEGCLKDGVAASSPARMAVSRGARGLLLQSPAACFPRVSEEGDGTDEEAASPTKAPAGGSSLVMGDWDYLADSYFTDEERGEIGRELARELRDRAEEIEGFRQGTRMVKFKKGELLGAGSFGQVCACMLSDLL